MVDVNKFLPHVPTYNDFIQTVVSLEHLLEEFHSETRINIVRHIYPYTVEVVHFNGYFQVHIFTFQGLLQLQHTVNNFLLLPF